MNSFIKKSVIFGSLGLLICLLFYQFAIDPKVDANTISKTLKDPSIMNSKNGVVVGKKDAPLTIVEFSDYGCGACNVLKKNFDSINFYSKYIESGKVRYIFKDVPANSHFNAEEASIASLAAQKQDKYWEMHNLLFQKSSEWSSAEKGFGIFGKYADQLNLNINQFNRDVQAEALSSRLSKTREEFKKMQFLGTPVLIIGKTQIIGAPSKKELESVIEKELAKSMK
ncbi:thioredoxin domain-containing protein [Priestia megaterium]